MNNVNKHRLSREENREEVKRPTENRALRNLNWKEWANKEINDNQGVTKIDLELNRLDTFFVAHGVSYDTRLVGMAYMTGFTESFIESRLRIVELSFTLEEGQ